MGPECCKIMLKMLDVFKICLKKKKNTWLLFKLGESGSHSVVCNSLLLHGLYTVHGILQARILEWVAILFSRGSSQSRDQTQVSCTAGGFFTS